jgi:uncharacterized membrane protein YqjE
VLKRIATTLLATAQTRLALLSNEIQVEKFALFKQLGLGLALVFCLGLAVVLAVGLAVVVWWESRVWVLGAATLLFAGLAWYFFTALRGSAHKAEPVFAGSLAELQEDLRQLQEVTGRVQKPD